MEPWIEIASGTTNGVRWRVERIDPLNAAPSFRVLCPCGVISEVGGGYVSHADVIAAALTEAAKVAR